MSGKGEYVCGLMLPRRVRVENAGAVNQAFDWLTGCPKDVILCEFAPSAR